MLPCRMGISASPRDKTLQLLECTLGAPEVSGDSGFEKTRPALQALSSMLAGRDEGVPLDMLPDVAACLLECLARHCSSNAALPLDRPSSRYFHTLLRTLQAAVSQMASLEALSLTTLVDCLRLFWVYGLPASPAAPDSPAALEKSSIDNDTLPASPRIISYRPPHLRSQQRASSLVRGQWRSRCDAGSASDCSDTESINASPDPHRASQIRIASLTCLQSMAKVDGKALHPLWSSVFPVYTPLTGKAFMTTLMDVIASDPQAKVRAAAAAAAAALMEGPRQRAYLAMAEHYDSHMHRGFTTLSTVLGKMIMCTHKGLLQALSSETSPAALTALLRFAAVLFGMTPYQRLPLTMLPGIMQDMQRVIAERIPVVATCAEELATMQCAVLACLGALITAYPRLQPPATDTSKTGNQSTRDAAIVGLPSLLAGLAGAPAAAVSAEALAALQPLASAQPESLSSCWRSLRKTIVARIEANPPAEEEASAAGAEHAAVQGLRLLGCYLKACAERAASAPACGPLHIPAPGQHEPDTRRASGGAAAADALQEWCFACSNILPQAVMHEQPAVRCAAMAALGSLSEPVYSRLSLAQQRQIWHCIQSCGAGCASAVHAASLKAMGTLAMCPSSHTYPGLPAAVQVMQEGLACPVASVQVAATWALANTADTVAGASCCPGHIVACIAEGALIAAGSNDKAQANAIRALGHLLISGHGSRQSTVDHCQSILTVPGSSAPSDPEQAGAQRTVPKAPSSPDTPEGSGRPELGQVSASVTWQQRVSPAEMSGVQTLNGEGSAEEQPPAWVEPGLRCLIRALQGGSVKVQWNACYAVGAILRCQHAAAAAQRAGLLTQLLRQLLQTLQHSSNFKTRTQAAAAFANVCDMALLESVGCKNVVQSLREASAVLQDDLSKTSNDREQRPKLDVTNIQSYQALEEQLQRSLCHLEKLCSSERAPVSLRRNQVACQLQNDPV